MNKIKNDGSIIFFGTGRCSSVAAMLRYIRLVLWDIMVPSPGAQGLVCNSMVHGIIAADEHR